MGPVEHKRGSALALQLSKLIANSGTPKGRPRRVRHLVRAIDPPLSPTEYSQPCKTADVRGKVALLFLGGSADKASSPRHTTVLFARVRRERTGTAPRAHLHPDSDPGRLFTHTPQLRTNPRRTEWDTAPLLWCRDIYDRATALPYTSCVPLRAAPLLRRVSLSHKQVRDRDSAFLVSSTIM